jgi:hypothetical protein
MVAKPDEFLLASLHTFFENRAHLIMMMEVIKNQSLSMRVLDWFVSNYSKKNNIFFITQEGKHFNIYLEYKSSLKSYSKRFFDPFCRGPRVMFKDHNGKEFSTTVGQLNFFRWAIKNELIEQCRKIVDDVENDMILAVKRRKNTDQGESRRELSKARIKQCLTTSVKVTISFN